MNQHTALKKPRNIFALISKLDYTFLKGCIPVVRYINKSFIHLIEIFNKFSFVIIQKIKFVIKKKGVIGIFSVFACI